MASDSPGDQELTGTEQAVFGPVTLDEVRGFLDRWVRLRLGSPIADVRFRSGRIDVVWGVDLADGRAVVIKTHRPPVDLEGVGAAREAQRRLAAAGFPCPLPLAGPDELDGRVLTAETLVVGDSPDGRDPGVRQQLAAALARHIAILEGDPELARRSGPGPSWCRYQDGPWPTPHDTLVDFGVRVDGFEWLDTFGRRAADRTLAHRDPERVVVAHADWYAGNTAFVEGRLVGTFDWELVADTDAVLAGFTAACFGASPTGGGGLSTPVEVRAFLHDFEDARGRPFTTDESRTATAAAAWILAFNARWQVALLEHGICDWTTVALVRDHRDDYLPPD